MGEVWTRLDQGRVCIIRRRIETCLKVTAHLLPKGIIWMTFEPNWTKGKEDMLQKSDLGWTDSQKDRPSTIGRLQC